MSAPKGRLTLCVLLVDNGDLVIEKHHILICSGEDKSDTFKLINKNLLGDVSEDAFESLDDLVWTRRHQLRLRHNFLKAEQPVAVAPVDNVQLGDVCTIQSLIDLNKELVLGTIHK